MCCKKVLTYVLYPPLWTVPAYGAVYLACRALERVTGATILRGQPSSNPSEPT